MKLYKCYIVRQCSTVQCQTDREMSISGQMENFEYGTPPPRRSSLILNMNRRPTLVSQKMPKDYKVHFFAKFGGTCPFLFNFTVVFSSRVWQLKLFQYKATNYFACLFSFQEMCQHKYANQCS